MAALAVMAGAVVVDGNIIPKLAAQRRKIRAGGKEEDSNMLGFELDFWDYATFITGALMGVSFICFFVWIAGLPGRIALARKHPEAEAVKLLGWAGILPTIYPWVQALIWAFKPTNVVDIRRAPRAEMEYIEEETARLSGNAPPPQAKTGAAKPAPDQASPAHPGATTSDGKKP